MKEAKPFVIDKTLIYKAFLKVKENKGSAGVDSVSLEDYVYVQRVECEEPCEGRLSRTVL